MRRVAEWRPKGRGGKKKEKRKEDQDGAMLFHAVVIFPPLTPAEEHMGNNMLVLQCSTYS